jgi:gliding motility-associated-like protein
LEITGGTGLYSIEWTGVEADGDTEILDLIAGTYTVTVTDENGCEEEESYEIILINELAANVNMTQPECFTLNGEAVLAIEGGTEPYSIIWPGIAADDELSASEIAPGSYTVSITDANLCTIEVEFEITEPYELSVETIFNNVLCNGENTGSIDITLTNSTGVIDYNWVNEELGFTSPTQDIENLFAGAYELTATDEIGCVLNETFEILETEELVITLENIQSETCYGLGNGSIEVSISGGTLDYQINWSGTGFSSNDEDILELASGDYTLNISDLNGCAASEIFTVNSGALIAPNISSIDSECSESTGSISVNIDSDNPIEDISWFDDGVLLTDGLITTIENISSGMYSVEITDDQGCSVSETILISDTDALSINADVNGVNCLGDSNGSILIIVTSGTEPYTLTWSGPVEIADDQYNPTNLTAGDYIASITDAEGCNALQEFSVLSPDSFSINETIINVSCFGNGDGVIALELIGGTEPFTIDWMDSDEDLDTLTNLTPGEYGVLITDANDCITEGTYEITEEDVLTLDISFTELFCVNQTSTDIDITVTGGLEPYTFSWTGEVTSTNEDLADAGIGTYTVLVTDAVNCTIEETITIAQGSEILIEVIETQPTCLTNNGSLTASAVGGSGLDYTFFWYSTGDTPALLGQEPTLDNLESGSYYLEVYDSAGCFNTAEVNLSNNQGEVTTNITNVLCAQDDSGSIEIEVVGLVGTLSVEWAGPNNFTSVDEDISGLTEGEYTVTVTDSNGCQLIETYEVESTNQLVEGIEITNICFGETGTGAIDILVTGGTAPYIISWTGNGLVSDQTSITDLNEGCYILEILDANSCLYIEEVCITSLDEIILNTSVTGNVCFADEQGQIELEISGGDPDYSVEWLNSDAEFVSDQVTVTQLATGVYTASIIDNSGCMANITASITSSPELTAEVSETPIICFGDENGALDVVYSGGVGALTLTWTGPNGFTSEEDQILNLGNGDYCYEVVGSVGCVISDCYALNNPELLNLNQTVNSISCFGANDGEISLEVTGGYTPYITDWTLNDSPFSTDEDISDLAIGEYAVTLSDSMGCIIEETFTVSEPTELTINFDNIVGATCPTSSDGAVEISASGGMLDYSYSWVLNGTEESIEEDPLELNAGDYQLTVTDANECITEIASVIIPALGTVEIIVPENISWCFTEDLQLIEPISAIAQSVEWTYPPSADVLSTTSSVFFQEEPGVYELVITGTDGPCVMTSTVEITIYEVPLADAGEDQEAELEDEVILGGNPTTDDFNTVAWTPFELLNESSLFNPSYVVVNSIQTFILTVTSPEGCVSEDSAQVILYPEIDIHSGFTPNSDNINDVWVIGNLQNYPSIEVWVYNRWGEELFYSKGYNQPWDGTYNGNSLPIGTYYYVIDFNKPGLQLTADGPVTILR